METPSIACGQKGQAGLICLMDPAEETWGLHSFMVFPPKLLGPKGKVPLSGEPYSIVTPHESAAPSHLSWPGAGGGQGDVEDHPDGTRAWLPQGNGQLIDPDRGHCCSLTLLRQWPLCLREELMSMEHGGGGSGLPGSGWTSGIHPTSFPSFMIRS